MAPDLEEDDMRRWPTMMLAALAAQGLARAARAADPWEGGSGDDAPGTAVNALGHGSVQTHDLQAQAGVADLDWIGSRRSRVAPMKSAWAAPPFLSVRGSAPSVPGSSG
jgi:hypothetical protein